MASTWPREKVPALIYLAGHWEMLHCYRAYPLQTQMKTKSFEFGGKSISPTSMLCNILCTRRLKVLSTTLDLKTQRPTLAHPRSQWTGSAHVASQRTQTAAPGIPSGRRRAQMWSSPLPTLCWPGMTLVSSGFRLKPEENIEKPSFFCKQ